MALQVDSELSGVQREDSIDLDFELSRATSLSLPLLQPQTSPSSQASSQVSSQAPSQASTNFGSLQSRTGAGGIRPSGQKAKGRTSSVWNHCPFPPDAIYLNSKGKSVWQCKYCKAVLTEKGGTAHMFNHLRDKHEINLKTSYKARTERYQQGLRTPSRMLRIKTRTISGAGLTIQLILKL